MNEKVCVRCGGELTGKQTRFCSERCSELFLKAEYRKRNKDKINAYRRAYRARGAESRVGSPKTDLVTIARVKERDEVCQRCGSKDDLQVAHVKPHWAGGTNHSHNMILLCRKCHHLFDDTLRSFWAQKLIEPIGY